MQIIDWNPFSHEKSNWFDSKWMFGIDNFDVVIGNPPYVRADSPKFATQRKLIVESNYYETLWEKWDLMVPFIEKGLKLLSSNGYFSFIVSNSITTSKFAYKLQDWIIENYHVKLLDYFENIKIFDAGVIPVILSVTSDKLTEVTTKNIKYGSFENKDTKTINYENFKKDFVRSIIFKKKFNQTFIPAIESKFLGEICYMSKGMVTNADEKTAQGEFAKNDLISSIKSNIHCKEYVEGKDIKEYKIERIKFIEYNTDRVPDRLSRPTFRQLYAGKKILRGRVTKGTFDDTGIVCNDSIIVMKRFVQSKEVNERSITSSISKNNLNEADKKKIGTAKKTAVNMKRNELENYSGKFLLKYLLAVINSKYAMAFLNNFRRHRLENYFYPDDFRNFPIPVISTIQQKSFEELVDKIISKKEQDKDTTVEERKIDVTGLQTV